MLFTESLSSLLAVPMRCSKCGIDNPAGSRFCNECGTPQLSKTCPRCAVQSTPDAQFCSRCRAWLEPLRERGAESQARTGGLVEERRHLTVLFCDLVNSTEMAAQLDPEEWGEIVANYRRCVAHEVERFGGYVAQ